MSSGPADGWLNLAISDIALFGSGDLISVANLSAQSGTHPVPVYGGNGISGYTSLSMVDQPTVILGRVGQKCGVVYRNDRPAWITDNALYARQFKRPLCVQFLAFALEAARLNDVKNKNDLPLLTQSILNDVKIPWPDSLKEQLQITEAMADVDSQISLLERMIVKKQEIKQGLMQQLLTGRTRLPGFTTPWTSIHLHEVLTVRHGKNQKSVESSHGRYPILATSGHIGWADQPLHTKPSVLIGRKGTIDKPQYQETPFWTVDTLFYTDISPAVDPRFLYYAFWTVDWKSMNEASGVPSLSSSRIEDVEIWLPDILEQRAIRTVLDDADVEIEAIQSRLRKAKSIKQGMMQELLTGRTRLPPKENTA